MATSSSFDNGLGKPFDLKHRDSMEIEEPTNDSFASVAMVIYKGMLKLQREDRCTDFEIVAGEKSFRCHKVVLASVSDYFSAMFDSGMTEASENRSTYEDISASTIEMMINILYMRNENSDPFDGKQDDELSDLLNISIRFQMPFLSKMCIQFFVKTMSHENCVGRWLLGRDTLCDELNEVSWEYMLSNFDKLTENELLLSLEFPDFLSVIQDVNLVAKSEDCVWKAIRAWIDVDEKKRVDHISELLGACCLTEIDRDTLVEAIAFDPAVRLRDDASNLVKEAILYENHPGLHGSMLLKYRKHMEKEQVLILIGRGNAAGNNLPGHLCFSHLQNDWGMLRPKDILDDTFSFCIHGRKLYASGRSGQFGGKSNSFLVYDAVGHKWERKEKMPFPLTNHAMVAMDKHLYVVGGKSGENVNRTVLKYSLEKDLWKVDGKIHAAVQCPSAVALGNLIYVFGGMTNDEDEPVNCIQVYNTKTQEPEFLDVPLPKPVAFSRAIVRQGVIYIVSSSGDVVKLSLKEKKLGLFATIPDFNRKNFGLDIFDNHLFVYGGIDIDARFVDDCKDEIFAVNLDTSEVKKEKSMPFNIEVYGFGNLVIDTKSDEFPVFNSTQTD